MIFFSTKQYQTLLHENEVLQKMINAQQATLDGITTQLKGFTAQLGTIQGLVTPDPLDFSGAQAATTDLGTAITTLALQATPPAATPPAAPQVVTGNFGSLNKS